MKIFSTLVNNLRTIIAFSGNLKQAVLEFDNTLTKLNSTEQTLNTLQWQLACLEREVRNNYVVIEALRGKLRYHRKLAEQTSEPKMARVRPMTTLEQGMEKLSNKVPIAFAHWEKLLTKNKDAYEGLPIDSCSVAGHPNAELFKEFSQEFLKGNVLDIGCGPQPIPYYLEGYPTDRIFGIDPISSQDEHPFIFVKGIAEYLPFEDRQFDVVVAATSLDHVLLLDQALEEVHRVLNKKGYFIIWAGFGSHPQKYDPYSPDICPIDNFHLFHLERSWFLEMMEPYFELIAEANVPDGPFMAFVKKEMTNSQPAE